MIRLTTAPNYRSVLLMPASATFIIFILLSFLSSSFAQTHLGDPSLDFERLAKEPGTEVLHSKRGGQDVTELLRGGVTVRVTKDGNTVKMVGLDDSGHGAVLCTWKIYIAIREELDTCFIGQYADLRSDLTNAITAINVFIVENSLTPVTMADIDAMVSSRDVKLHTQVAAMSSEQVAKLCKFSNLRQVVLNMANRTSEQRKAAIADLLSVPRPPVMNPCL